MMAVAPIADMIKSIIGFIIFAVSIGLFLFFYNTVVCFMTTKHEFGGAAVNSGCSCKSGAYGYWNDKSAKSGTMCCRTANWQNDYAKGWCKDMEDGDSCLNDWQCNSALCFPGGTGDSVCVPKKKPGEEMEWNRGWSGCTTGTSALWNDQKSNKKAKCCPTVHWQNNFSNAWCTQLPDKSECIFDFQCTSGYCSPGNSSDSICAQKRMTGEKVDWSRGASACASGTAALWNDKGPFKEQRCCPTQRWVNNWAKAWCTELGVESSCLFDDQCASKNCYPGDTAESVCKPKKQTHDVAPWWRGNMCVSGKAALWNDRVSNPDTRCCPTDYVANNWAKGWCMNLPTGSECIFNDQCSSKKCVPEISIDGTCQ